MGAMRVFQKSKCYVLKLGIIIILLFGITTIIVSASTSTINIDPLSKTVSTGESFSINVSCVPGQPIKSFEFKLSFDPSLLQINSVTEGDVFNGYSTFFSSGTIDNTAGTVVNIYNLIVGAGNVSSFGNFVIINCTAKDTAGVSTLDLYEFGITNESGFLSINVNDGSATIQEPANEDPPPGDGGYSPPAGDDDEQNNTEDQNKPPETPTKPSGPSFIEMGVEYVYSSSTYDIDGDLIRYKFNWGDGTYSDWSEYTSSNVSISMSHSWNLISTFEVKVMAQDVNNTNSSWSSFSEVIVSQVVAGETPSVADINYSSNESDDLTIEFDASGSFDPDENIANYLWDFGDGENGTGISTIHTYANPGTYTVILNITDNKSNILYSQNINVIVGSEVEEESEEKGFPLIYVVIGIIGLALAIFICLMVFFRDNVVFFFSQNVTNRFSHKNKLHDMDKIRKLDKKIQELKKTREKIDYEKRSDTIIDKQPFKLENYSKTHEKNNIETESLYNQEKSFDDIYIHKKIEEDYITSIEQKVDNIIISNKEDVVYKRKEWH